MAGRNPEELNRIPVDVLLHQVREWERHREPLQTDFDGHFPEAGDTEESFVRRVLDELPCIGAESGIAANKPQKGVRIE
jgi:hypothetical protein